MHETAARFASPLTDRYIQAAEEFRLPFWDWGLGIEGGTVPEYFTQSIIEVTGTDGLHQTIPNPLHQYDFHSLMPGDFEGKVIFIVSEFASS
jgi:tyrosinase